MPITLFILFLFHPYNPDPGNVKINTFTGQSLYGTTVLELLDDFDKDPKNDEDKWIGMDKFWHWAMAFALTGSSYHLIHNQINISDPAAMTISLSGTLFFSILKEVYDLFSYGLFSYKDLCYDIMGMATGYIVFIWDWGR
jgi:uncharacterized protein YfiM (DUF2279 family)